MAEPGSVPNNANDAAHDAANGGVATRGEGNGGPARERPAGLHGAELRLVLQHVQTRMDEILGVPDRADDTAGRASLDSGAAQTNAVDPADLRTPAPDPAHVERDDADRADEVAGAADVGEASPDKGREARTRLSTRRRTVVRRRASTPGAQWRLDIDRRSLRWLLTGAAIVTIGAVVAVLTL